MTTLTVQMPTAAIEFIQQQATAGGFDSAGAYVTSLVESEQQRLEEALIAGLDSGPSRSITRDDWDTLKQRVAERQVAGNRQ